MVQNINNLDGRSGNLNPQGLQARSLSGRIGGETVKLQTNSMSLVQQSAEEMTFFASERLQKPLRHVKFTNRNPIGRMLAKRLEEIFKSFPDLKDQSKEIVEQLRALKSDNPQALMAKLKDLTPGSHLRFLVLASFVEQGSGGGGRMFSGTALQGAWEQVLYEELKRLWREKGKQIKASFNISKSVQSFLDHGGLGQPDELRALYHDSVLNYGGLEQTFEELVKKYGREKFRKSVDFLLAALGEDLAGADESIPKPRLRSIIDDMYQLKTLSVIYEKFESVLQRLGQSVARKVDGFFHSMMETFLYIKKNNWAATDRLNKLILTLELTSLSEEIFFMREFRELVRHIPIKMFDDDQARIQLLGVLQDILDERVALEEEEEG